MNKKLFFGIVIPFIILIIGILIWLLWFNNLFYLGNYINKPITKCFECFGDLEGFWAVIVNENCKLRNGVVVTYDRHPIGGISYCCYQKAPDAGKPCTSDSDCLSRFCHLEDAITSGACTLIKKEFTGEYKDKPYFYTATYSCPTNNPGLCAEVDNESCCHHYSIEGTTLIEVLEAGPIR